MRPESTSVTLRRDLTETAQEYAAGKAVKKFIGPQIAPISEVGEAEASYPIMNRENFKKVDDDERAEDGAYNRITGEFGKGSYECVDRGLEYVLDDRRRKRYKTWVDFEQAATRILYFRLMMAHERRIAALTLNNGSFTLNGAATAWSDSSNAVPLTDLQTGIEALEDNCGVDASDLSLIIPRADFKEMMATTQVTNLVKYTYPGERPFLLKPNQVASMLQIKEVLIAKGAYDSAPEGETESHSQVWTAGASMLAVLADGPEMELEEGPQLARTLLWTEDSPEFPVMERYRDDAKRAEVLRARFDYDQVLIGALDLFGYKQSSDT